MKLVFLIVLISVSLAINVDEFAQVEANKQYDDIHQSKGVGSFILDLMELNESLEGPAGKLCYCFFNKCLLDNLKETINKLSDELQEKLSILDGEYQKTTGIHQRTS